MAPRASSWRRPASWSSRSSSRCRSWPTARTSSVCGIYGGEPIEKQLRALERGVDIVVGTPGRVLDHIERRTLYLGEIMHVVLDEADRMLDIGFRPDIERILRKVPDPHQTLLLSATISAEIRTLARKLHVRAGRDEPLEG